MRDYREGFRQAIEDLIVAVVATPEKDQSRANASCEGQQARIIQIRRQENPALQLGSLQNDRIGGTLKPNLGGVHGIVSVPPEPIRH